MAYDIGPIDGGNQGAQRLLALADHLQTLSDDDYDHSAWQRSDGGGAMCALGHGVSALPAVIGLRWRRPHSADVVRLDGSGVTLSTLALASEVFDLSSDEAATIFGIAPNTVTFYRSRGVADIKPKAVAAALRGFALARLAAAPRVFAEAT